MTDVPEGRAGRKCSKACLVKAIEERHVIVQTNQGLQHFADGILRVVDEFALGRMRLHRSDVRADRHSRSDSGPALARLHSRQLNLCTSFTGVASRLPSETRAPSSHLRQQALACTTASRGRCASWTSMHQHRAKMQIAQATSRRKTVWRSVQSRGRTATRLNQRRGRDRM